MSDIDLIADARAWLATQGDRIQTHGELCHRWHPACLVARLISRAGQTDHQRENLPERESTTLTAAERRAISEAAAAYADNDDDADCERIAATLRGLLDRTGSTNR